MKRESHWKQNDPITQLRCLLGSIEGELSNVVDGIASSIAPRRALERVKQCQKLATAIAKGDCKWDEESSESEEEPMICGAV